MECVWDGPTWLKSKQRLKIDFYKDLEHLMKVSLRIPDASQADVLEDLRILKGHCMQETSIVPNTSEPSSKIKANAGTKSLKTSIMPYKLHKEREPDGERLIFRATTSTRKFRGESFEVLNKNVVHE